MATGRNGTRPRQLRFDRGDDHLLPQARPALGPRARAIVLVALFLFLGYETTIGPWKQHQIRADSYAERTRFMTSLAEKERRLARLKGLDPDAAMHRRRAWYYSRLAADSSALERAFRRLSWTPWGGYPADPLPPDPLTPTEK